MIPVPNPDCPPVHAGLGHGLHGGPPMGVPHDVHTELVIRKLC